MSQRRQMRCLRRLAWFERGDSLPFALVVLAVGALLVGVLLFRISSSLKTLVTFDAGLRARYSSDAGVEYAVWRIAHEPTLRQTLIASQGTPQIIDMPLAVNAITPTVQAVCVVTVSGGYVGIPACGDGPEGDCPGCAEITPDIYVNGDWVIVGGPDEGQTYGGLLRGTKADDIIMGTNDVDEIYGYNGDDIICGLAGDDQLHGGNQDDTLCGGQGNDHLYGENQTDLLCGGPGDDLLDGGKQHDVLCGGEGNDYLYGEKGNDNLDGGPGDDELVGGKDTDNCCNGTLDGCERQDCGPTGAIYGVFDIQSTSRDITTTVRISETTTGEIKVRAWHSQRSD